MLSNAEIKKIVKHVHREFAKEIQQLLIIHDLQIKPVGAAKWVHDQSRFGQDPAVIYEHKDNLNILSVEAKQVIKIINENAEVSNGYNNVTKALLRDHLINRYGWSHTLIDNIFDELTAYCRSL